MAKDRNDHWADACWWAGFRLGFGVAWVADLLTALALWAWYRWSQGP